MQYMLLVHHDENVFTKMDETIQQQLLDESIQLTHQLNASGQYVSASRCTPRPQRRSFACVVAGRP